MASDQKWSAKPCGCWKRSPASTITLFDFQERLMGGCSIDKYGSSLTDETLADCQSADAVLLGAVGGPQYDNNPPKLKPETGWLALRAGLGVFANLRPAFLHETLNASPLKADIVRGTDLIGHRLT